MNLVIPRFPTHFRRFQHSSLRTGAHVRNLSDAARARAATITTTRLLLCLNKHRFLVQIGILYVIKEFKESIWNKYIQKNI